jgi:hypothetical protein
MLDPPSAEHTNRRIIDIMTREPLALMRPARFARGPRWHVNPIQADREGQLLGVIGVGFLGGCLLAIGIFVWLVGLVCTLAAEILLSVYGTLALFLIWQVALGLGDRRRFSGNEYCDEYARQSSTSANVTCSAHSFGRVQKSAPISLPTRYSRRS